VPQLSTWKIKDFICPLLRPFANAFKRYSQLLFACQIPIMSNKTFSCLINIVNIMYE